jgi:hypothetical protein
MIRHTDLGVIPFDRSRRLKLLIDNGQIAFAGNVRLEISGKRMKSQNRVFFVSEDEAIVAGFRPCGHCMRAAYTRWKIAKQNYLLKIT